MSNKILVKRGTGKPANNVLDANEIAYDTTADVFYIGKQNGGNVVSKEVAGEGAFVTLGTGQTITGAKTFDATVVLEDSLEFSVETGPNPLLTAADVVKFAGKGGLTSEDVDVIAGTEVSKGTALASKAVVLDANKDISSIRTIGAENLVLSGNLTVTGTQTILNTATLQVEDKNIELGVTTDASDASADGGGITLKGTTDKTFNYVNSTQAWTSSENIDLAVGKGYRIGQTFYMNENSLSGKLFGFASSGTTELTSPQDTVRFIVADDTQQSTKYITWANLKSDLEAQISGVDVTLVDDSSLFDIGKTVNTDGTQISIRFSAVEANAILGGPATGSASGPTFRALVAADIPSLSTDKLTSGTLGVGRGGTGQTSYTNGQLLIGNTTGNTLTKATLTAGTGIAITNGTGSISIAATNNGTVTSVGVSGGTTGLTTSGGPITSSGDITLGGTLNALSGGTGQTSYTDGQLLIGRTSDGALAKSTLTAGTGISITNGSGTVSIAATNNGTVTSVGVSGGTTGLTTSGGPVTSSGTITLAGTLAVANGGTGITSFGTGVATFLGTPSSANLAAAITDETGTGALVFATSPTLVSPTLGAAVATSINRVTITSPATSATLTLANGSSLITSGGHSLTLTTTASTNVTLPTTGTLAVNNQTMFIGTTSVAINRASANLALTGISSVQFPGSTSGTVTLQAAAAAGSGILTLPAGTGTLLTDGSVIDGGTYS